MAVFSDHHCPHVDPELHKSAVAWLRETKPDEIVVAGDLLDYDAVSRHREPNPGWAPRCRTASTPGTACYATTWMPHRCTLHSDRRQPRGPLYGTPCSTTYAPRSALPVRSTSPTRKDHAVLSLPHLLRLDEIGIDFVGGQSEYQHYRHKLADTLAVRHGYLSKERGARASAVATIRQLRHSLRCHRPLPPARGRASDRA